MTRFRSADALGPEHVGRRVTVRRRLQGGAAADVIGVLEGVDRSLLAIRRKGGELVEIEPADVIAARVIPEPPPA